MANDNLCWFHGKLSREGAEELLLKECKDDGAFIIRESNSALGDYVLTLLYQANVWHYQIRRHGEDAFFSIDDKVKIFHGLDQLVEFYRQNANGLETRLTTFIKKDPPPNDSRSHGVTNLLHRATKENNHTVVSELLKCGYRNVDAKNQAGQTAVHLAALYCDENILKLLLNAGVNVNCMDTDGYMPLHYAARKKSAAFIRLLIEANANVQGRNIQNGYVPLHEAAQHGNLDAVKELLAARAALLPRTKSGEFPIDLAKEANHSEVEAFLRDYKLPPATTFQSHWHHGTLSRDEAKKILMAYIENMEKSALQVQQNVESTTPSEEIDLEQVESPKAAKPTASKSPDTSGCFLVRYSENSGCALSLLWNGSIKHFQIRRSSKHLYIDDGPYLPSIEHLVEHFMRFADGLPVSLKYPVPPRPKPPLPYISSMPRSAHKKNAEAVLTPTSPTEAFPLACDTTMQKDNQQRKFSLDLQKVLSANVPATQPQQQQQQHAHTLQSTKKKKQKETAASVVATLLRSTRKNSENSRKKPKDDKVAAEAENAAKSPSHELQRTETFLRNLTFSTEFAKLNVANHGNEIDCAASAIRSLSTTEGSGTTDSVLTPTGEGGAALSSSMPADSFYNVPTNNKAVTAEERSPTLPPLADVAAIGIEKKTEDEVAYFTKSDVDIAKEREQEKPQVTPPKFQVTASGYVPTVDIRVFHDSMGEVSRTLSAAELREFSIHPERLESMISTISNESEVNRYLCKRQPSNASSFSSSTPHTRPNYFIPAECLELDHVIGEGEFGSVYQGRLIRPRSTSSNFDQQHPPSFGYFNCAIKTLRDERGRTKEFLREASVMIGLQHHCIVQLIGISKGERLMMIQDLMPLGSMLQFILDNKTKIKPNHELKLWASQIACGMQYLESRHFVHRDLAARNILLASRNQAKISDFGLSRTLGFGFDFYQASQGGKWPIKWYAPESFNNGLFSHASDVWSFGVTLWEMFSLGEPPYGDMRGVEAIDLIESGERLAKPPVCPDHVYEIMKNCWNYKPKDRPTFRYLTDFFAKDPDYQNIKELIMTEHIS